MYSSYKRESKRKEMMASSSKPSSPTLSAKRIENAAPVTTETPPPASEDAEGEENGKKKVPNITISKDSPVDGISPPLISSPLPCIEQETVDASNVLSNSFKLPRPETSRVHVKSPPIADTRPSTASVSDSRPMSTIGVLKNPLSSQNRPVSSSANNPVILKNPLTSHSALQHTPKASSFLPPVASASHIQTMFGKNGVFTITNNNLTKTQPIISQQPLASFTLDSEEAVKSSKNSSQKGSAESTRTLAMLSSATSSAGRRKDEDMDSLNKFRRKNRFCCEGLCDAASLACCICCDCCHCDLCCLLCRICTAV
ncbi:uncharacterized protein [Palaemon carinicauda]|uniref:uncharacterized protein n=1 Tax=Palaemon carinicauda TaxID=392227 RepID=UPI0035B5D995